MAIGVVVAGLLLPAPALVTSALSQGHPGKGFAPKGPGSGKHGEFRRANDGNSRPMHERMSPEERRQLRRDIDQHGRDIYRDRK